MVSIILMFATLLTEQAIAIWTFGESLIQLNNQHSDAIIQHEVPL